MIKRVMRKYSGEFGEGSERGARAALEATREALAKRAEGNALRDAYILGEFSYADVAMAMAMELVCPAPGSPFRRRSAAVACCTWEEASKEFADLLDWRDAVVERHGGFKWG
ncbi:unnamed protein product [Ostreobium quekettii]|uniref:Glutathione S-transferase n=1 Tax=Ostreobium quekettii TaxID=121088 RepID=A0A8S1J4L4_9CHLO|nr:unnamed protein product [Ostreobium quekettii]|eukprot:evm.model.scf_930.2 EVM.evm.TU.scf_930.2   scf_930:7299-7634(-)